MARTKTLYTVNLSRAKDAPRNRRATKAVHMIRNFVSRHSDAATITLSDRVNKHVWQNGPRNPPAAIEIQVVEEDDEAFIELPAFEVEREEEKAEEEEEIEREEEQVRTGALPAQIEEILREGTVDEAKDALQTLNKQQFQAALNFEKEHKNRTTLVRFIESNMN